MSVVVHEVSHGFMANILGDDTAKHMGRLTLNPIKHIDPVGSILLPLFLFLTHSGFMFGWAKPVPYNPYNLRDQRWGELKVAAAGPLSNIALAVIFGLVLRFSVLPGAATEIIVYLVSINLVLALFNLIPIAPLDGSKVLFALLPYHQHYIQDFMERYWLIFIVVLIFFVPDFISPTVDFLFRLIVGG